MTPARAPLVSTPALAALVVLGTLALPLLQLVSIDFERTAAAVAFAPALIFGWRVWSAEAGLWLVRPRGRAAVILGTALVLFSVLFAAQPAPALVQAANGTVLLCLALLASGLVRTEPRTARWLLLGIVGGGLLGALTLAWPWLVHPDPRNAPAATFHWLYPHIRHIGLHLLPAAALAPVLLTGAATPRARIALWLAAALLATALVWSGGRTPLLGIAVAAVFALWHLHASQRRSLALAYALIFAAGLLACTLLWTTTGSFGWWRAVQTTVDAGSVNELSSRRLDIWKACVPFITDSPWLGYGPDGYRFLTPKMDAQQPHNVLVQWALACGIPGLLLGLAALARLLWRPLRRASEIRPPVETVAAVAVIAAIVAAGLTDGSLYHILSTHAFALAAGLVIGRTRLDPAATPPVPATVAATARTVGSRGSVALALAAALVLCVHGWLFNQLIAPDAPAPTSTAARVLRAFPSTTFGFDRWLDAWEPQDPKNALEWTQWAQRHSAYAWLYHLRASRLLARHGFQDAARIEFHLYETTQPKAFRKKAASSSSPPAPTPTNR